MAVRSSHFSSQEVNRMSVTRDGSPATEQEPEFEQLAREIEEAHYAAEQCMHDSLTGC